MLETNPDTVCRLVELARTLQGSEPATTADPLNSPADDWGEQVLAGQPDSPMRGEFTEIIKDLEPDQQQEVVALLWLGRGDYSIEEWSDALGEAQRLWSPETAEYLLRHPMLADHLQEALDAHGYSCQDGNFISPE